MDPDVLFYCWFEPWYITISLPMSVWLLPSVSYSLWFLFIGVSCGLLWDNYCKDNITLYIEHNISHCMVWLIGHFVARVTGYFKTSHCNDVIMMKSVNQKLYYCNLVFYFFVKLQKHLLWLCKMSSLFESDTLFSKNKKILHRNCCSVYSRGCCQTLS